MLAYEDLLNISPYEELFKEQTAKDKPADLGMQGITAGGDDQKGSQMMMFFKALSQLAGMFGGGGAQAGGAGADSGAAADYGGPNGPYGGSNNTGWTGIAPKAW